MKRQLAAVIRHTILKECARELAGELDWMMTDKEFEALWDARKVMPKRIM
jgi:hypothetical protein